jgi:LEA14-like dessication related protein
MELSRTHRSFIAQGYSLETLGPNCKTALNFWLYLDNLTEPQWRIVVARNLLTVDEQETVRNLLKGVVYTRVWDSILFSIPLNFPIEAFYASCELIGMQDILNMGEKLTYLPMFDGL